MKIEQFICQVLRLDALENIRPVARTVCWSACAPTRTWEGVGVGDSSPEVGIKVIIDVPFNHNVACGLREQLLDENPLET